MGLPYTLSKSLVTYTDNAIWRIDGVLQSGRTGTVDCDNKPHNIQFNGG